MREEKLQWFLIKKFIVILVVVSLVAYAVTLLVNRLIWPIVLYQFFLDYKGTITLGSTDVVFLVIVILFLLLLRAIQMFLPAGVRESTQWIGVRLQDFFSNLLPQLKSDIPIFQMSRIDTFFLFLISLAIAFVVILPYLIGAGVFARITIREFKKIQEEREEEKREFDRRRNLMLSDIAHDLRTPMTTVNGYAKALADGMVKDPQKQQGYLRSIQSKSLRMNDLINLLFEYVKLDSEGFVLNRKELDLCELLRENAALVYSDTESVGMEFEVEIPEEPIMVSADSIQFSRVITNLLTNAVRHNDRGTRIGIFVERNLDEVCVMIADSGALIPEEQSEALFEPFARGDQSRGTGGGSGLGLSIAKKVVEMHEWELKLVQQPAIQRYRPAERYTKAFIIRLRCE